MKQAVLLAALICSTPNFAYAIHTPGGRRRTRRYVQKEKARLNAAPKKSNHGTQSAPVERTEGIRRGLFAEPAVRALAPAGPIRRALFTHPAPVPTLPAPTPPTDQERFVAISQFITCYNFDRTHNQTLHYARLFLEAWGDFELDGAFYETELSRKARRAAHQLIAINTTLENGHDYGTEDPYETLPLNLNPDTGNDDEDDMDLVDIFTEEEGVQDMEIEP